MPVRTIISIWPLFAGLSLIGLAVGVQGSLLGVRAEIEGFDDYLIGLLMSCYFAGFLAGSLLTPKMIQRVGHPYIRRTIGGSIGNHFSARNLC